MLRTPSIPFLALLTFAVGGCQQFYDVDEACAPSGNVPGGSKLGALEKDAMLRVNCWRRLAGISQASVNPLVQVAADGQVAYVGQNPAIDNLTGKVAEHEFLVQQLDDPGFTGTNAFERLTDTEHGAGYVFYDIAGTGIWEYIKIIPDFGQGTKSGSSAIDELMRDPEFRQIALQPSWIDGAYAEYELPTQWFIDGGWPEDDPYSPPPVGGRVYYMMAMYTAPHIEHADRPVLLPKPDMVNVPLYARSENQNVFDDAKRRNAEAQISWPITFLIGALDPANYFPVDQNIYGAQITAASIVGPEGPLETQIVHPGDAPDGVWPAAYWHRTVLSVYTRQPFEPSTQYQLFADLSHPEGDFAIDFTFRTANEDEGVNAVTGTTPSTTVTGGTQARSVDPTPTWSKVSHQPPGSLLRPR